ncbi:MAG: hypothetical protein HY692_09455 [Cyanobacteria bacterium NC_groundwater_1444_Ag_S-0.65um_54_12]|nr:hypothetical protein [Cyanobacteria bacterium NC_groundwater_1444_Ag_S-0.65um_54_12]
MNDFTIFGLTISPERLRQGLIALFLALFAYLMYQGPWPEFAAYQEKTGKILQNEQEIVAARSINVTRQQVENRYRNILAALNSIRFAFSPRKQILSILLVDLSQIFRDAGVELISFEPLEFKPLERESLRDFGSIAIRILARADYPSLILLLERLARYDRLLHVESPQLRMGSTANLTKAKLGQEIIDSSARSVNQPLADSSGLPKVLDVELTLITFTLSQ